MPCSGGELSKADTFLSYTGGYTQIDGKGMVGKKIQGTAYPDQIEEALRKPFVTAMKHGNILHFCLRNGAVHIPAARLWLLLSVRA